VAALLFSPRLWVQRVSVEGNQVVSAPSIVARLHLGEHTNIVRLPVEKLRAAVLQEPQLETVEIHRSLPGTVRVVVAERIPWACAQTADGSDYVIDKHLVPFRTADIPPVGLPLLKLSSATGRPPLGKPMSAPGLDQVSKCLAWSKSRPDFPLDAVSIDGEGKLCLNRAGGAKILLGSGRDLDKKLQSLETLLAQRGELRDPTRVAYVNLFAYDAPAVAMRPAVSRAAGSAAGSDVQVEEVHPSPEPSPSVAAVVDSPPSPDAVTKASQ